MTKKRFLRLGTHARAAIQGELGAFSQRAAINIFGPRIDPLPCVAFDGVFEKVMKGEAAVGVIPIENSLAGSIHQNCRNVCSN
jgi:prephenate dehydratase